MNKSDAYTLICKEYLEKCKDYGCDACIAESYCLMSKLKYDRYPQDNCVNKLQAYLKQR